MDKGFSVAFSHVGIYVTNLDRMVDFYTRFLGFVVTDRGGSSGGSKMVFMTRDPTEHHQLVMVEGRPADTPFNVVNQLSFRVDSLRTLKELHAGMKNEPVTDVVPVSHGNALSVYFRDPEGNRVELLIDTPWYVPQPFRIPLDLSMPDDQLWAWAEERARATPGFKPRAEWKAEIEKKLAY